MVGAEQEEWYQIHQTHGLMPLNSLHSSHYSEPSSPQQPPLVGSIVQTPLSLSLSFCLEQAGGNVTVSFGFVAQQLMGMTYRNCWSLWVESISTLSNCTLIQQATTTYIASLINSNIEPRGGGHLGTDTGPQHSVLSQDTWEQCQCCSTQSRLGT